MLAKPPCSITKYKNRDLSFSFDLSLKQWPLKLYISNDKHAGRCE